MHKILSDSVIPEFQLGSEEDEQVEACACFHIHVQIHSI